MTGNPSGKKTYNQFPFPGEHAGKGPARTPSHRLRDARFSEATLRARPLLDGEPLEPFPTAQGSHRARQCLNACV